MVPESVYTYDVVSFFLSQKCEVGTLVRGLITNAEFKNSSRTSTQVATMMKWKTDVPTL